MSVLRAFDTWLKALVVNHRWLVLTGVVSLVAGAIAIRSELRGGENPAGPVTTSVLGASDPAGSDGPSSVVDTDGDGLFDDQDRCPSESAATGDGCPADRDGDGRSDDQDRCPGVPASTPDGCPAERVSVSITKLAAQGRVSFNSGADMREVLVGGEVDPDGPYMYIGGGSVEGEVMVAVNRQFESVTGRVGIVSTADCPENDADLAIKDGDGHVLWSAETGGGPQNFRVRVASLDQVVLYGRVSSSFDAGCYATQVGWAGVEFREP